MLKYVASTIKKNLLPGEKPLYVAIQTPYRLVPTAIGSAILGIGLAGGAGWLGYHGINGHTLTPGMTALGIIMGLCTGLFAFASPYISYMTKVIVLTPRRLLLTSQYGFNINELPLYGIRDVQMFRPMSGLLCKYGHVAVTAGDGRVLVFRYIPRPTEFMQAISQVAFPQMQNGLAVGGVYAQYNPNAAAPRN
ncbi:hypothetical protein HAP94_08310 [Acidithiobacillus ferrivorans]|nr:hypothetical protein [Acidithiobacillus ferrivorans]